MTTPRHPYHRCGKILHASRVSALRSARRTGRCLVGPKMRPRIGGNQQRRRTVRGELRYGDRAVVFTTIAGRFRSGLTGTVVRLVSRLGDGERVTVMLDQPTDDHFVLLEVPSSEVVSLDREAAK